MKVEKKHNVQSNLTLCNIKYRRKQNKEGLDESDFAYPGNISLLIR